LEIHTGRNLGERFNFHYRVLLIGNHTESSCARFYGGGGQISNKKGKEIVFQTKKRKGVETRGARNRAILYANIRERRGPDHFKRSKRRNRNDVLAESSNKATQNPPSEVQGVGDLGLGDMGAEPTFDG